MSSKDSSGNPRSQSQTCRRNYNEQNFRNAVYEPILAEVSLDIAHRDERKQGREADNRSEVVQMVEVLDNKYEFLDSRGGM